MRKLTMTDQPKTAGTAAGTGSGRDHATSRSMRSRFVPWSRDVFSGLPNVHQSTIFPALFSAVMLAGCAVGPDYQRPETTLAAFHSAVAVDALPPDGEPNPPLDRWWSGFNDPELDEIVERALAQNLDLSAALARVEEARAAAAEAGAQSLPIIATGAGATTLSESIRSPLGLVASHAPGYFREGTDYNVGLGASWELDLFGGLKRGAEAAAATAQAAEATRLGLRITIAADAADAYLQMRGTQARLAFSQQQIDKDAELLRLVRARSDSGAATEREVAQAQALLSQARATIPPLRTALESQLNRLDVLMGVQPGTYATVLAAPRDIPIAPSLPAQLTPAEMLRQRPDIIAAERRLMSANARIGVAVAEYYPKVSLSGLLGFESLGQGVSPSQMFSAAAFQPQATAALRWRLFDFGRIDAEVAQAKSGTAASLADYRQTVLRAAEDVENAFTAYVQLRAQTREVDAEVSALKTALRTSQEAFEAGSIPLTDVLDADRQLLSAQDELALVRANSGRAAVASFRSMGGGGATEARLLANSAASQPSGG